MLLTLSVIVVALNGYAKNIAQDVAIDAARFAALADQGAAEAEVRAVHQLGILMGALFSPTVSIVRETRGQICIIKSNVILKSVPLGLVRAQNTIRESASATCEIQ